ncbi:MAG: lipopolysaccharide biosynthesis protein [Betaproteobacteria bacterium]
MRRNTAWAFVGNSVYAGCQWAVFVLLVKRLTADEAGAFAYATAITGPIFVLANVRLRNLLATGIESPRGFTDYLNARLLTTVAAVSASLGIGAYVSSRVGSFEVLAIMTLGRACDAISDACHGLFQRELDMRSAAIGRSANGLLSVGLVALVLALRSSLVMATAAYATGSALALAAWDLPRTARLCAVGESESLRRASARRSLASAWRLIVMALPLGLSSAIGSVQANVPRYVIASCLGTAMLAKFAAISYITLAGHLVVNATSQAALPLLAIDVRKSDARYRTRLGGLVAGTIVLGALAVAATIAFGREALIVVYGREYAEYTGVLLWLVVATVVTFASVFLGTGTTARHRFGAQVVITATSLVVVASCTGPLVSRYGLVGAAWALVAGAVVELSAYGVLTLRDFKSLSGAVPVVVADAFAGGVRQ